MSSGRVLVTCRQMQNELAEYLGILAERGYEVLAPELGSRQQFSDEELLSFGSVVGIIAGDDVLNERFFRESAPTLRVVIRWGIGMDSVDMDAAREHGVTVRNTPGVFGHEVADAAFAYLLALARGTVTVDRSIRRGDWPKFEGVTLHGAELGVVGLGAIGREVANRGHGFGMRVLAYDPFVKEPPVGVELVDLSELAHRSRFIVLACPLTSATFHLVDAEFLSKMRSDSYLVNVSRGPVVDQEALVRALDKGALRGAALDVFEREPLEGDSPLRAFENVVLGAHNASNTREGVRRASASAVASLLEELST